MDAVDRKILAELSKNGRVTVKDIAGRVSLTSPAVAERIRRMEKDGTIAGYTVRLGEGQNKNAIRAIISIYVPPQDHPTFTASIAGDERVVVCYQVTGNQSHMLTVNCPDIAALDELINRLQKFGQTNTQIILSTVYSRE